MPRLDSVLINVIVSAIILLATVTGWTSAWWIVMICTALVLVLMITTSFGMPVPESLRLIRLDGSIWPLHVLYGVNVLVLGIAAWWLPFGAWVAIGCFPSSRRGVAEPIGEIFRATFVLIRLVRSFLPSSATPRS